MASYTITILSEEQLQEYWTDPSAPNFAFSYNEQTLDECDQNEDGTWTATYETIELTEPNTFTYLVNGGEDVTITLVPGEYGIRPNSKKL
jgi:hypothetical protein